MESECVFSGQLSNESRERRDITLRTKLLKALLEDALINEK